MITTKTQFSVFLVNKPGVLARVCGELGKAKINIEALTMMDSSEHGVLRLVAANSDKAREVLTRLNIPLTETEVMAVEMPNHPGAMADVCGRLAEAHVNINYAYITTGASGGKALAILKVADTKKAMATLSDRRPRRREPPQKVRQSLSMRR